MVKIRVQGTKDDIKWLEDKIRSLEEVDVTESSDIFHNQGTNRYFRKYMEVEKELIKEKQ